MGPFEALYWHKKIIEAYAGRCLNIFLSWLKVTLSDSTEAFLSLKTTGKYEILWI